MVEKLLEIIKLAPKYLIGLTIVTGILIFGQNNIISSLGLTSFVSEYRKWIGIIFLLSLCFTIVDLGEFIFKKVNKEIATLKIKHFGIKKLKNLTPEEKSILGRYIFKETKTQNMSLEYGAKNDLEQYNIIYRSSNIGRERTGFSYDIQPWGWDYLNNHNELLYTPIDKTNF